MPLRCLYDTKTLQTRIGRQSTCEPNTRATGNAKSAKSKIANILRMMSPVNASVKHNTQLENNRTKTHLAKFATQNICCDLMLTAGI
jgi:hypothetical protein